VDGLRFRPTEGLRVCLRVGLFLSLIISSSSSPVTAGCCCWGGEGGGGGKGDEKATAGVLGLEGRTSPAEGRIRHRTLRISWAPALRTLGVGVEERGSSGDEAPESATDDPAGLRMRRLG